MRRSPSRSSARSWRRRLFLPAAASAPSGSPAIRRAGAYSCSSSANAPAQLAWRPARAAAGVGRAVGHVVETQADQAGRRGLELRAARRRPRGRRLADDVEAVRRGDPGEEGEAAGRRRAAGARRARRRGGRGRHAASSASVGVPRAVPRARLEDLVGRPVASTRARAGWGVEPVEDLGLDGAVRRRSHGLCEPDAGHARAGALAPPRRGAIAVAPPSDAPRRFHASMDGYAPTPLRRAPRSAERIGVAEVLVKDESTRLGLPAFKILGASWAVYRALLERAGAAGRERPHVRGARRARGEARPADAQRGHRRQPRARSGAHGTPAGARRARLRPCRHGPGPDRRDRVGGRERDRRRRWLRRRGPPLRRGRVGSLPGHLGHVVAGLRGRSPLGRRGLRDDLLRDRGGDRRRAACRARA